MRPAVLVVDDSEMVLTLLRVRLVALGVSVHAAASAMEARASRTEPLHAALLDIDLGDGFGPDVASWLRESQPELPIAFLTASFEDGDGTAPALADARSFGPVFSKHDGIEGAVAWIAAAIGGPPAVLAAAKRSK